MSAVLAIDPGPVESAWVIYDSLEQRPTRFGKQPNEHLLDELHFLDDFAFDVDRVVIEKVESFGMAVGAEVFETVFWTGRYAEAAMRSGRQVERLGRLKVKTALCHDSRAKDSNIRQALVDRFSTSSQPAIGIKRAPGPLHGISGDVWSALAVAVAWTELSA